MKNHIRKSYCVFKIHFKQRKSHLLLTMAVSWENGLFSKMKNLTPLIFLYVVVDIVNSKRWKFEAKKKLCILGMNF